MMVLFTSRSEKKALLTTRQILDSFADRIGNDTWRTVITQEGLLTVKNLLRRSATKNTAVACHWLRSRSHSQLLWIVGSRSKYDETGRVPVNTTAKNLSHHEWEQGWPFMPPLKALTALAALFHDWGKASDYFQKKLQKNDYKADPLRHEWISVKLISALVTASGDPADDEGWLSALSAEDPKNKKDSLEKKILAQLPDLIAAKSPPFPKNGAQTSGDDTAKSHTFPKNLPPLAQLLSWLILSHHRLPSLPKGEDGFCYLHDDSVAASFTAMLEKISADWNYANGDQSKIKDCFSFKRGLLFGDDAWRKNVRKWAARLLAEKDALQAMLAAEPNASALRPLLLYAREALMLGDHFASYEGADQTAPAPNDKKSRANAKQLWGNTNKDGSMKETLTAHLTHVMKAALAAAHALPAFARAMGEAKDLRLPAAKNDAFLWQDKAVAAIRDAAPDSDTAWFVLNMASTGRGKTFANAKIMQAIAPDGKSLRYILALGLRSLTLQTGTEYRQRMGISPDEFAVLIGSAAIKKLYEKDHGPAATDAQEYSAEENLSASAEDLLPSEMEFQENIEPAQLKFLQLFFPAAPDNKGAKQPGQREGSSLAAARVAKNRAFLYKPVLALTIDHIMSAVESTRGGRHLLPFLRLMSSDIIIDEIDDFSPGDLTAISRLVHLAGIFGRSVILSSATIPPDLAAGMYRAHQDGLALGSRFFGSQKKTCAVWSDEFQTQVVPLPPDKDDDLSAYRKNHDAFVAHRVKKLQASQDIRRKAYIVPLDGALDKNRPLTERLNLYFDAMRDEAIALHKNHHIIDKVTGKRVSFGIIRLAHIDPCVYACLRLLTGDAPEGFALRLMCYHSRQVLLLRHEQERYLDKVLHRSGQDRAAADLTDPILRHHIDHTAAQDVLFIVVATPVEEIGRDHDFDWGVAEPSSFRALIQLAGRLLRHRLYPGMLLPNFAIMQYNLRSLYGDKSGPIFTRPGFETGTPPLKLDCHDLKQIVDETALAERIDATPRIQYQEPLDPAHRLIDLEHAAMQAWQSLESLSPRTSGGWQRRFWWLTALPQRFAPFRAGDGRQDVQLFYEYDPEHEDHLCFCQRDDYGDFQPAELANGIDPYALTAKMNERLWLRHDYIDCLRRRAQGENNTAASEAETMQKLSHTLGEIVWQTNPKTQSTYYYSQPFGLFQKEWKGYRGADFNRDI